MDAKQKKYHNPYDFMSPIRDPMLFSGRHGELEEIEYYLKLSKSEKPKYFHPALVGPRSAGKTSFLNIIEYTAYDLGYLAVKILLNKETVQNDVLFFKEVFDGIITKGAEKGLLSGRARWFPHLHVHILQGYCLGSPCCPVAPIPAIHHFWIKGRLPGNP
jgi:hypothetical protein